MYSGSSGIMTVWSTLSIILENSAIPLYRLFPICFPLMEDRQSPRINASATADNVSRIACREIEKYGLKDASAVAAI